MTKLIPLTRGQQAIVDDDMYDYLMQWKWCMNGGYAARKPQKTLFTMHRIIVNAPDGMDVDHIDGNKLNNTRANLRICTHQQNMRNQKKKGASSQYKGVSWNKQYEKWQAIICIDGRLKALGRFTNEVDAARAYDAAARTHHGEFARLNFPDPTPEPVKGV